MTCVNVNNENYEYISVNYEKNQIICCCNLYIYIYRPFKFYNQFYILKGNI